MVQIFRATRPTATTNILQDNIDQIDNDNTLRSMFSGDVFPTDPTPVIGQACYRTDLDKWYIYTAAGWKEQMKKDIYDPQSKNADAFHMDNMVEGTNTKIMTSAERSKIVSLESDVSTLQDDVSTLQDDVSVLNNRVWDVIIEDHKSGGVGGGDFDAGDWRTRDLNTIMYNSGLLISLSSNRFTLSAGTYCIDWDAPAACVNRHKSRLYNFTVSAVVAYGTSEHSDSSIGYTTRSLGTAVVTVSGTTAFIIQHWCSASRGGEGFGFMTTINPEIYTRVRIKKMS